MFNADRETELVTAYAILLNTDGTWVYVNGVSMPTPDTLTAESDRTRPDDTAVRITLIEYQNLYCPVYLEKPGRSNS